MGRLRAKFDFVWISKPILRFQAVLLRGEDENEKAPDAEGAADHSSCILASWDL